jgi:hypothetical protein
MNLVGIQDKIYKYCARFSLCLFLKVCYTEVTRIWQRRLRAGEKFFRCRAGPPPKKAGRLAAFLGN